MRQQPIRRLPLLARATGLSSAKMGNFGRAVTKAEPREGAIAVAGVPLQQKPARRIQSPPASEMPGAWHWAKFRSPPLGRRCRMPVVREKIANRTNLLSPWLRDPQKKKRKKGWRLRAGCGTYQADGEKRSGADKKKSSRISKSRAISASQSNVGGRSKSSSCGSWFSWSVGPMRRITKTKHGGKERQHTTRALVGEP